jgi:nucleoside-diphosphate-sugar epimerase
MTILFIGGSGNISAECAALLHNRGHEILVLSRGQIQVPAEYRAIQADRINPDAMRSALKGAKPHVVINFLGYELSDIEADFSLFNGSVRQYIFISSATVYEKPPRKIPVAEDAPLENRWWDYAQKKIACEQRLQHCAKESGFPVTIVRPSHTYSKLWVPNAISSSSYSFASRFEHDKPVFVHDDGETPWTLTAACDFAVGLAGVVGNEKTIGESFHITGDEMLTWNHIYAEIADAVGAKSPQIVKVPTDFICKIEPELTGNLKGDKAHPGVFDNSKIKKFVPEFQTRKPFHVGVRESVAWLRAHPDQQHLSPKVDQTIDSVIAAWRSKV